MVFLYKTTMFIGREHELALLRSRLDDTSKAQLIILYGRRRIGKSTLIREALKHEKRVLYFEGIEGESSKIQIRQFHDTACGSFQGPAQP